MVAPVSNPSVAYAMNGKPLSAAQESSARLIVSGLHGMASVYNNEGKGRDRAARTDEIVATNRAVQIFGAS
ncbi:hypothetical protein BH10CHL1_BH10CHL1_29610 [soil metagenome]